MVTFLSIFILVYIKQNIKKKSNIIILSSLVVGELLISIIIETKQDIYILNAPILMIISFIVKMIVILSLIYFTNNTKSLKKILLIFYRYVIFQLLWLAITILAKKDSEISIIILLSISMISMFIICLIFFMGYCLMIFLAFKILLQKNDNFLIDRKKDEET